MLNSYAVLLILRCLESEYTYTHTISKDILPTINFMKSPFFRIRLGLNIRIGSQKYLGLISLSVAWCTPLFYRTYSHRHKNSVSNFVIRFIHYAALALLERRYALM